ncbi:MAG: sialic acid synthase [Ilumatobacteraceae bacterium]|nr:sialic acid synthase [Ilumatobacteraceae bacterium]
MIIERDLRAYVVLEDEPLAAALTKISANKQRILFCVDSAGHLVGSLSDGDVRRWLVSQPTIELATPSGGVARRDFASAAEGAPVRSIEAMFSSRIGHIPLLDDRGRLVAIAIQSPDHLMIGSSVIADDAPTFTIAEIGNNHNGSKAAAMALVEAAHAAGADAAKFQMRDMAALYRNSGKAGNASEDLGTQYTLDLLSRFQLTPDELFEVFDFCKEIGILPLCTAWEIDSARLLDDYGIAAFKTASADLTNHDLLRFVAETGRPVVVSTGMSDEREINEAVGVLRAAGSAFVLLHCNSTYPAPFRDINLRYLERLRSIGDCPVGYSGHERGMHVPIAAVAMGARVIEKHITLDASQEGVDHKVSLLPDEFRAMVSSIRDVEAAFGFGGARTPSQGELMNRVTLAKSVVARSEIASGTVIDAGHLDVKGPGRGLQPNRMGELVGRVARRDFETGDFFFPSDLEDVVAEPRPYEFRRPWGVAVRHHDAASIIKRASPSFVEFHLSYRDMEVDPHEFLQGPYDCGYAVHCPDLFSGDHILNLADSDHERRERSIVDLQAVIDLARGLGEFFPNTERPTLVVTMGGFTKDKPIDPARRPELYDLIIDGLSRVDDSGVEIVAQTLPPFPWLLGGQWHHNLFVEPEDTIAFSEKSGYRLCLDVSHTKLAANHAKASFRDWTELLAPHTAHLHIVDAAGVDGEGLQIGDGEVDFAVLGEQIDRLAPGVPFIPEIWQGHRNGGEDFWIALDRLEAWL